MPENRQSQLRRKLKYGEFLEADKPIDESSLTDEELQSRFNDFRELAQTKGEVDPAGLTRELVSKLKSFGIANNPDQVAEGITQFVLREGRFPDAKEIGGRGNRRVSESDRAKFENFVNDQDVRNQFSGLITNQVNAPNVGGDIKRLEDIIGERGRKAQGNKDIQAFLGELPQNLASQTGQFMDTQRANAETQLRDFLDPQIRQSLAARGLLTSGDLSAELASAGEGLQGGLNQQHADLQAQDAAFFENAAYQVNLKKVLDANQNLAGEINFQRGNALNQQENRFQVSQQNQADQFGVDAFRRQQQQNMSAQNARLKQQQDIQKAQSRAGQIGNIGRFGGLIAGAALAAPTGGLSLAAGAGLGATSGGILSDLYTDQSLRKS